MIVKIQIEDNGGWREPISAETTEGECIDCSKTGMVLRYLAPHLSDEVELCRACFAADDQIRVVPTGLKAEVLRSTCTGPNLACRIAHKAGRSVHVIPGAHSAFEPALVMPRSHYATSADGIEAIYSALESARTVRDDADLRKYREYGLPYFLPVGWVDPSRRTSA